MGKDSPKGKGRGKGPPPAAKAPADDFSLPLELTVGGEEKVFASDEDFAAAVQALDNYAGVRPLSVAELGQLKDWQRKGLLKALETWRPRYRFPHSEVTPLEDLDSCIDWASCVGVERSDTGSEGILFVELAGRKAVCIKCPAQVVAEAFGARLCQRLAIRCPAMRVVERDAHEGCELFDALVAIDAQKPAAERKVHDMLSKAPLFLIIEYLPATELANFFAPPSAAWSQRIFGLRPGDTNTSLSTNGKEVLGFFGAVLAFDMLVNNFDRLPCVWDNTGNPGNIMFADSGDPIPIDNMPWCLNEDVEGQKQVLEKYLDRVRFLVWSVAASPDTEHRDFKRVRDFLREGCKEGHGWIGLDIDVGEEGTLAVQRGFLETVQRVVGDAGEGGERRGRLTQEELQDYVDDLLDLLPEATVEHDDAGPSIGGFEAVDPRFCARVADAFREALQEAAEPEFEVEGRSVSGRSVSAESTGPLKVKMPAGQRRRQKAEFEVEGQSVSAESTGPELEERLARLRERKANLMSAVFRCSVRLRRWSHHARSSLRSAAAAADAAAAVAAAAEAAGRGEAAPEEAPPPRGGGEEGDDPAAPQFFPLQRLAGPKPWPPGVHPARREDWLSPEDFYEAFGIDRDAFRRLRPWQQKEMKKMTGLF